MLAIVYDTNKFQQYIYGKHNDFKVKYVPGNQLLIADTLIRASQIESTSSPEEFEVHLLVHISKERVDELKRETESGSV